MKRALLELKRLLLQPDTAIQLISLIIASIILAMELIGGITSPLLFGILLVLELLCVANLTMVVGRLAPIERVTQESNRRIGEIDQKLDLHTAALRSGIANIYGKRMGDERAKKAIEDHIDAAKDTLLLIGVALPDFFDKGPYTGIVAEKLAHQADTRFRVLLLHPESAAADERAHIEEGRGTVGDMKYSIESIQGYLEDNSYVEARLYDFPPMVFLLMSERVALVEPYHLGRPGSLSRGKCIGGRAPLLEINRIPGSFYETMEAHFDYVWQRKLVIPVYSRIVISDYDPAGKCVRLENRARYAEVLVSGWTIGPGSTSNNFISIPESSLDPQSEKTIAGLDLGDTRPPVLTLRNVRGVVVAESKLVDEKYLPQGYIGEARD